MKVDKQTVFAVLLALAASIAAAGIMYAVTENMSALAFFGWTGFFAAPQLALLPSYRQGLCRILDWVGVRK